MVEVHTFNERLVNTTKVFFTIDNGNVVAVLIGNNAVPTRQGFQFYVENHIAEQIDKCELYFDGITPRLRLREGETLDVREKTEKELEIERLKYELEKLQNEEENTKNESNDNETE